MNITVFGATGTVGRLLVEQALAEGHDVTAFTRAFADRNPGLVRHGFGGSETGLRLKIAREDVAAFLLAQVEDGTYLRRAVSLSS